MSFDFGFDFDFDFDFDWLNLVIWIAWMELNFF